MSDSGSDGWGSIPHRGTKDGYYLYRTMNARIKYLKDYVEEMRRQMNLFDSVNVDMLRLYGDRMIRVSDSFGNISCGFFRGFCVESGVDCDNKSVDMYIRLQLPKKDGTLSNKIRKINCRDALFRLMGSSAAEHPVVKKKRGQR